MEKALKKVFGSSIYESNLYGIYLRFLNQKTFVQNTKSLNFIKK